MPIIRGHHSFDGQFTQIPNAWIRDARLSYKARGLLAELLSHAPGFEVSRERLSKNGQDGDRAIRSAIAELESLGYLVRSQNRTEQGAKNTKVKNNEEKNSYISNFDSLFSEFWKEYPRKKDKGAAVKAFRSALKRTNFESIMKGVKAYKDDPERKPEYTKFPATWLNADAWDNEVSKASASEAAEYSRIRREKELERTREFLNEQERMAAQAVEVPKCKHGKSIVRCLECSAKINV